MTAVEGELLANRLEGAVQKMAGRYGIACMEIAYAQGGTAEHVAAHRAAARQYRALMRLTRALADLVGGAR